MNCDWETKVSDMSKAATKILGFGVQVHGFEVIIRH
jgi:hypothetical protein